MAKHKSKNKEIMWRIARVVNAPLGKKGNLPNKYLAEKVFGVSESAVSNWINQKGRGIPFKNVYRFCTDNNVSLDFVLFGRKGDKEVSPGLFARHVDLLRKIHNSKDQTYIDLIGQSLNTFAEAAKAVKAKDEEKKDEEKFKKMFADHDVKQTKKIEALIESKLEAGQSAPEDKEASQ